MAEADGGSSPGRGGLDRLFYCATIVGIPAGLTMISLGFRYLTLDSRRWL